MTSIASWQAAHPALNTSIFRVAAISLVPSILAQLGLNGSRWQRDGRRYPLEVPPRSSVELQARNEKPKATGLAIPGMPIGNIRIFATVGVYMYVRGTTAPPDFGH